MSKKLSKKGTRRHHSQQSKVETQITLRKSPSIQRCEVHQWHSENEGEPQAARSWIIHGLQPHFTQQKREFRLGRGEAGSIQAYSREPISSQRNEECRSTQKTCGFLMKSIACNQNKTKSIQRLTIWLSLSHKRPEGKVLCTASGRSPTTFFNRNIKTAVPVLGSQKHMGPVPLFLGVPPGVLKTFL